MDFTLSPDILQMRETVQTFIREQVKPHATEIEQQDEAPFAILKKSRQLGLFGLSIPEQYGGLGLSMVDKCAVFEELGKTINGYTTIIGAHNGIGSVGLVEFGTPEQKLRYLPKMAAGEWMGAFALTEPEAGSNAAAMTTRVVRHGSRYILDGQKFTSPMRPTPMSLRSWRSLTRPVGPKASRHLLSNGGIFRDFASGGSRKNGTARLAHRPNLF